MPWAPGDAARHNKKATGKAASQWSTVANSVLKRTGSDGQAIREANAVIARRKHGLDSVKHFAAGGKVARGISDSDIPGRKIQGPTSPTDPNRTLAERSPSAKIVNVYRGKLEPEGDSAGRENSPTAYPDWKTRI